MNSEEFTQQIDRLEKLIVSLEKDNKYKINLLENNMHRLENNIKELEYIIDGLRYKI